MGLEILVIIGILICAIQAVRESRLLYSAIWLALTSALVALQIYLLGAAEIAVIELSVGAGLVTVLFVFAINITGEEPAVILPVVPRWVAWIAVAIAAILLAWLSVPELKIPIPDQQLTPFATALWKNRSLDAALQVLFIFSGVLGVLGLMDESKPRQHKEKDT